MRAAFIDSKMTLEGRISPESTKPVRHFSTAIKRSLDDYDALLERADYAAAEISEGHRAVVSGGVGKAGEHMSSVIVTESSPTTITTDKVEVLPGERPYISGSGWQPNEAVTIVRRTWSEQMMRTYAMMPLVQVPHSSAAVFKFVASLHLWRSHETLPFAAAACLCRCRTGKPEACLPIADS